MENFGSLREPSARVPWCVDGCHLQKGIFVTLRGSTGEVKQFADENWIAIVNEAGLAAMLAASEKDSAAGALGTRLLGAATHILSIFYWIKFVQFFGSMEIHHTRESKLSVGASSRPSLSTKFRCKGEKLKWRGEDPNSRRGRIN